MKFAYNITFRVQILKFQNEPLGKVLQNNCSKTELKPSKKICEGIQFSVQFQAVGLYIY